MTIISFCHLLVLLSISFFQLSTCVLNVIFLKLHNHYLSFHYTLKLSYHELMYSTAFQWNTHFLLSTLIYLEINISVSCDAPDLTL